MGRGDRTQQAFRGDIGIRHCEGGFFLMTVKTPETSRTSPSRPTGANDKKPSC